MDETEFIHEPTIAIKSDPKEPISLVDNEKNFKETGIVSMNIDANY